MISISQNSRMLFSYQQLSIFSLIDFQKNIKNTKNRKNHRFWNGLEIAGTHEIDYSVHVSSCSRKLTKINKKNMIFWKNNYFGMRFASVEVCMLQHWWKSPVFIKSQPCIIANRGSTLFGRNLFFHENRENLENHEIDYSIHVSSCPTKVQT